MAKSTKQEGPLTVNINVLNDGTVALVFPRSVQQFTASADEMTQLGVNLIKASTVALQQLETRTVQYDATYVPIDPRNVRKM